MVGVLVRDARQNAGRTLEECARKLQVTPEQVEAEVSDYIERFYNRQRRHSTLGHVSPVVFELRHVA